MKELIKGAYDLHVHSAPDVLPRKMDDLEMAQRVADAGMAGYAIKSHYFCTSERAELVRKLYPACDAVGTLTLNSSVGGINPSAVEMACRSGVKLIWFPTCDCENERKHVFGGENRKLPYWASIVQEMEKEGLGNQTITICKDGRLKDETLAVLDVIARYDVILATGHISHEECFLLAEAAAARGVRKMIITHVDFPSTFYSVDEQKKLLQYGAYMEHCYTTFATGKVDFSVTLEQIREIGTDRVIISTDLGQATAVYPDEGLLKFAEKLLESGIGKEEIRQMAVINPRRLLGLEEINGG